jgi:hypothetical protein
MEQAPQLHSTSTIQRSKCPFEADRSAARGSVEAMPHPARAARPHNTVSRILKFQKEEQEDKTELQKEKNDERKKEKKKNADRLHSLKANCDPRRRVRCAPPDAACESACRTLHYTMKSMTSP